MTQPLRLRCIGNDTKDRVWKSDSRLLVGPRETLQVVLCDSSVSCLHADVRKVDNGWWIYDLDSTSGTYVNGMRLGNGERVLHSGDIVQFGEVTMMVEIPDSAENPERTLIDDADVDWICMIGASVVAANDEDPSGDELLDSVLRNALYLFSAQRGGIALVGSNGQLAHNICFPSHIPFALRFAAELARHCLSRGKSIHVWQSEGHRPGCAYDGYPNAAKLRTATGLCLLLRTARKRLGAMYLMREGTAYFCENDLRLAHALAAHWSEKIERNVKAW